MSYSVADYQMMAEDKRCFNKAGINYHDVSVCFDIVGDKMDKKIEKKLAGDRKKLAQYNKDFKIIFKKCEDKYKQEDGSLPPYYMALASQCTMFGIEKLGKKYGVSF
ncbi:MAG: hypothetical protein WDW20_06485 [Neisseriaceae bacterium]